MADPARFDALVFDLGRVLLDIDFRRCFRHWGASAGVDPALIEQRWSMDASFEAHERGEIGCAAFFDGLRQRLAIDLDDDAMEAGWNAIFNGEIAGVRQGLAQLADRHDLYLWTNTNRTHHALWRSRHADLLQPMRGLFVSSELGWRKPEQRVWAHLQQQLGHQPERILFADDHLPNVAAAARFGLHAVHVAAPRDSPRLMEALLAGTVPAAYGATG